MKLIPYFLLVAVVTVACSKAPDAVTPKNMSSGEATRLAGIYDIMSVESSVLGHITYPLSVTHTDGTIATQSAQIVLVRESDTSLDVTYIDQETGQLDVLTSVGSVDIDGNDLYLNETKLGTVSGFMLVFSDDSGTVTAKKR